MSIVIELDSLGKTYRPRAGPAVAAVDNLSFTIPAGQVFGLLGAAGAGKTTAIKLLGGLLKPTSGRVYIGGRAAAREPTAAPYIAVVPEAAWEPRQRRSVWEHFIRGGAAARTGDDQAARAEQLLRELGLWERRNTPARDLSPGEQRGLVLAGALSVDPAIVLLDEPTGGLDGRDARVVLDMVRRLTSGRTVVLATSHLAVACDLCDRVAILDRGRLAADLPVKELLALFRQEHYEIRVRGHLGAAWSEWFAGMSVTNVDDGTAIIAGPVSDQAALHGVLERLYALNLALLGVSRVEPRLEDVFTRLLDDG